MSGENSHMDTSQCTTSTTSSKQMSTCDMDGDDNTSHRDQIEIGRHSQTDIQHMVDGDEQGDANCDLPPRLDITDLSESLTDHCKMDKASENEDEVDEMVDSFKKELLVERDGDLADSNRSSDWDLKTLLSDGRNNANTQMDVLIMSEAGKPIYCYSGREDVTTLMGVCVALLNYVIKTQNDQLKTIRTQNGLNINFAIRSPLVIMVVSRRLACFDEQTLINQIHAQIISSLTLKKLKGIFQQAPTYDLKRIIYKNDFRTLDILIKSITTPITDFFPTYKTRTNNQSNNHRIFNNVISFYTSSTISMPRSSSSWSWSSSTSSTNVNNGSMVFLHDHKPNVLSRVYVPIAIMNSNVRELITSIINRSVSINSDIVFSILFHIENDDDLQCSIDPIQPQTLFTASSDYNLQWNNFSSNLTGSSDYDDNDETSSNDLYESFDSCQLESDPVNESHSIEGSQQMPQPRPASNWPDENEQSSNQSNRQQNRKTLKSLKLISVCNHTTKFRINPLDIQLLYALIKSSHSLLSSTESLWLPLCLSRVDANRFLHAHVSYLSDKYCLVLLDVDHNNFDKCRKVKENIQFKLEQIRLSEPIMGLGSNISELGQPHLQYVCHQTPRHCIVWQSSIQSEFSPLNYYLIDRMQRSQFKTLWLRSIKQQCALLGWQTATFQLYAQFDGFVTKQSALETVTTFLKWFKKEEDKLIIKDN